MEKILFINACVRKDSRTKILADHLLSKMSGEITEVKPADIEFPANLKQYIEQINVLGITFAYTSEGTPKGLCKAKKLYYVTTVGGGLGEGSSSTGELRRITGCWL